MPSRPSAVAWFLLAASPSLGAPDSPPAGSSGAGSLAVRIVGNGRVCARLHEAEVLQAVSPDRIPETLFTTTAYRFQLTAAEDPTVPVETALFDSGVIATTGRQRTKLPPAPVYLDPRARERVREAMHTEIWLKQAACRPFPRTRTFELAPGEYVLRFRYGARSPGKMWFSVVEEKSSPVKILAGETATVFLLLQDDGHTRDIRFLERPEPGAEAGG